MFLSDSSILPELTGRVTEPQPIWQHQSSMKLNQKWQTEASRRGGGRYQVKTQKVRRPRNPVNHDCF